jgi:hypothetical protein
MELVYWEHHVNWAVQHYISLQGKFLGGFSMDMRCIGKVLIIFNWQRKLEDKGNFVLPQK